MVARKRHLPKICIGPHLRAIFEYKIAICLIASRSRRVEHYTTTPAGSFSGLHQKTPVQLPRQVSPGSVFCIAPQFAFLPQIFRATGSAARNQRALHGSIVRAPPFPKQYAQRKKHLWKFWIMLPKPQERGNWGHFDNTVISVAYLRRQTRVFGVNRKD